MFGFNKNKKKKNTSKNSPKAAAGGNGGTPVVRRKKHLFGGSGSQYPVIKALKIPEQVPSAIIDTLSTQAEDEDGAVRKVNGGYAVITLDEKTLEEQGLVPKNKSSDFGQFSASLRKRDNITSTTLKGDLDHGMVVIAPNEHTLESLDEFDQLRNGAQFGWAIFPDNLEDDDLDAHVKELGNTVELADLTQISENEWGLKLSNNKMVVDKSESGSDDEDYDDEYDDDYDTDDNDNDEYESSDDEYEADDDDDNQQQPQNNQASAHQDQSQNQQDQPNQQVPQSENPIPPEMQEKAKQVFNEDNQSNNDSQSNSNDNQDVDPSEPPASLDAQSGSNIDSNSAFWTNLLHGSNPQPGDIPPADNQPSQDGQQSQGNQVTPSPQNAVQSAQNNQQQQSNLDFQTTVGTIGVQQLYDQDLDLKVDTNVFNQMFDQSKPFEVAPLKTDENSTDLFKHVINEARADANTKLVNLNNRHRQQLVAEYIDRVQQMIVNISKQLEINNANTSVGEAKQIIEQTFRQKLANQDTVKNNESQLLHDTYNKRRQEAGEQARLQAQQAFDEQHDAELQRHLQQVGQQVESAITDERVTALHDLNQKRKQAALLTYKDVNSHILHDLQDVFNEMRDSEANLANTYEQNLQETVNQLYREDVKRQQAIADAKKHDDTVDNVQKEKKRLIEDQQNTLASIKQENQDALENLASQYKAAHQKVVDSYDAKIEAQTKELQSKDNRYKELQDDITRQINQRTADIKADYEARLEHSQNRYKDLKIDLKDARQQNLMDAKDHAEREKLQAEQYEQFKKDNKRSPWSNSIAIGCVALVLGAGGMYTIEKSLSNNTTSHVQSTSNSSNVPNITINGNPSSSSSSSESKANDSSKKARDSQSDKSDNSDKTRKSEKSKQSSDKKHDYGNKHVSVDKK